MILTGDVLGIDFRQSLQADDAGDTYTAEPLSRFSCKLLLGCVEITVNQARRSQKVRASCSFGPVNAK